jgi:SagB-type dehydrogenase family enzyme
MLSARCDFFDRGDGLVYHHYDDCWRKAGLDMTRRVFIPTELAALFMVMFMLAGGARQVRGEDYMSASKSKGEKISLPSVPASGDVSLEQVLRERRSVREFIDHELDLETISKLLWSAQGITGEKYGLRTAPSAGATYPLELLVQTSEHLARYLPREHSLQVISDGDLRAQLAAASHGQACVEKAPALFIFAAEVSRTSGRYGGRAERYVHIEVGCAAENLMLQAVAMGLGSVAVGAYDDKEVKAILDLPKEWDVFLMVPVGKPDE